jgi:hypothetical protein
MSTPVLLWGRRGFGDALYARPAVAACVSSGRPVYLATPWPQLFADLDVGCVPQPTGIVWSQRNLEAQPASAWARQPVGAQELDMRYRWALCRSRSMPEQMMDRVVARLPVRPLQEFSLPPLPPCPVRAERIAVLRPVTGRNDWVSTARNPRPEYLNQAAELLAAQGYHVVSVAAIHPDTEPYLGEPLFAHSRFDHAELTPLQLLALMKAADVVVSGPGWPVPAALAAGTPLIAILGGAGGTNGPPALVPSWYRRPVSFLIPKEYCRCRHKEHDCSKEIPRFSSQLATALAQQRTTEAWHLAAR